MIHIRPFGCSRTNRIPPSSQPNRVVVHQLDKHRDPSIETMHMDRQVIVGPGCESHTVKRL